VGRAWERETAVDVEGSECVGHTGGGSGRGGQCLGNDVSLCVCMHACMYVCVCVCVCVLGIQEVDEAAEVHALEMM
jgi:hypothetical protein